MAFFRFCILGIVLFGMCFGASGQPVPIRYFNAPVLPDAPVRTLESVEEFGDSTASNSLFLQVSETGLPISYFREIKTSVCFDGKCRLLDILVYWNPVGGYLGFEMPPGEFLSKTDHDPFSPDEYLRLHEILSDSLSPLADYTFEELVPGTGNPNEVDAVSSATLKEILDHIIPGAAYTTYRLWHLVYGKTSQIVSGITDSLYTDRLALALLNSDQPSSQIWALNRLSRLSDASIPVIRKIAELTRNPNLNLSHSALSALTGRALDMDFVQSELVGHLKGGEYALKKTAIQKFGMANTLDKATQKDLLQFVGTLNGDLLGALLNVFFKHEMTDTTTLRIVSEILESGNRYTSGKVLAFLEKVGTSDAMILRRMEKFKSTR
jgi:hypothetical protein